MSDQPYKALVPEPTRDEAFEAALDRVRKEKAAGNSLGIIEAISLTLDATVSITTAPLVAELEQRELELGRLREALGKGEHHAPYLTDYDRQMIAQFCIHLASPETTDKEGIDSNHADEDAASGGDRLSSTHDPGREGEPGTEGGAGVGTDPASARSGTQSSEVDEAASEGAGVAFEPATDEDRKAAVRLAICDALLWTDPDELRGSESMTALREGVQLLDREELPESLEERFLEGLLETGWNLAPAAGTSGDDKEASE